MGKLKIYPAAKPYRLIFRTALIALVALLPLLLTGCGGTKVYSVQKSVMYNGNLYNVSNVKVISSSVKAKLSDGAELNLERADKKAFNQYVEKYGPLPVRMVIVMDDQELVYFASATGSFSDFDKRRKSFSKARESVGKFMADKKKTQLKLK